MTGGCWWSRDIAAKFKSINQSSFLFENEKRWIDLIWICGASRPREQSSPSIPQRSSSAAWIDWSCCSCGGLMREDWFVFSLICGLMAAAAAMLRKEKKTKTNQSSESTMGAAGKPNNQSMKESRKNKIYFIWAARLNWFIVGYAGGAASTAAKLHFKIFNLSIALALVFT